MIPNCRLIELPLIRSGRRRFATAILCSLVSALTAACEGPTPVFLLTVDTLRADHLSVYGYSRATDPNLAAFAEDAVVFTRAFSPRGKTTPSYASLMTGNDPARHGVRRLGDVLNDANETVAERLRAHGYVTGGFVSSTVMIGRLCGLDQGFEVYDDHLPSREKNRVNFERRAEDVVNAATKWLDSAPAKSFFFLHLIDPHGPYLAPPPFRDHFKPQPEAFESGDTTMRPRADRVLGQEAAWRVPDFQRLEGKETRAEYLAAYDEEIRYADHALGRVLAKLKDRGLFEDALIVVTADHGEAFGEDGLFLRHGVFLHDATQNIPLIIRPPGGRRKGVGSIWEGAVSLVDVAATLLDYGRADERLGIDGTSLRPVLEGEGGDADRVVFSENFHSTPQRFAAHHRHGSLRVAGRCSVARSERGQCQIRTAGSVDSLAPQLGQQLRASLDDWLDREVSNPLPFETRRSYTPGDVNFVETFVAEHNRAHLKKGGDGGDGGPTRDDVEGLRSLGYVE